VAVDGTDVETWGALHGDAETVELDEEAAETQLIEGPPRRKGRVRKALVFGTGPDGRKIYTKDPDARAGHRSATNSRPAGRYVGYELHLGVQARDVRHTNGIDRTTLGPDVPNVITAVSLVPAGTYRAKAIVPLLFQDEKLKDVVWDPGYSLCRSETAYHPLAAAGIHSTFTPVTHHGASSPSPATPCSSTASCSPRCCPRSYGTCRYRHEGRAPRRRSATRRPSTAGPEGAMPPRRLGHRRGHAVALPVLLGAAAQPPAAQDHAALAYRSARRDRPGPMLCGHPHRPGSRPAAVAALPGWHHRVAHLDGA